MIPANDYAFLQQLLQRHSGLSLSAGKEYLIESRLSPVAASLGYADLAALVKALRVSPRSAEVKAVCEAMTTNESLFFRDGTPFEVLRERILPELARARQHSRRLRIWCAAASTGQEPYSVAMTVAAHPLLAGWQVEIVGTDYSAAALQRAREGVYSHFEVQRGLPIQMLMKHFAKEGDDWRISPALRRSVTFREANLLESFVHYGTFDLVLCRNVLIYFDLETKRDVLDRMRRHVAPDGYLFLGGSETVIGVSDGFERVPGALTSVYRPIAAQSLSRAS
ncbi:MAG: protein-glutamate O-methyltransferase CheR [Gemmatimonadetes bacterium]|nr:protein-glutamate O-methyltransferase CheR [Gemmatimonadota bacterium]